MYQSDYGRVEDCDFGELVGKTLTSISRDPSDERLVLSTSDGQFFMMWHQQDCCEHVYIEDVVGDLADLVGSPVVQAEAISGDDPPKDDWEESYTWTFYKLATIKGSVTIRWYGSSDGYYSERVDFGRLQEAA